MCMFSFNIQYSNNFYLIVNNRSNFVRSNPRYANVITLMTF